MSTAAALEPVPLRTDAQGVIRIGGTRVMLDTVVHAFETGASAEQIAEDYPLRLDDVYAVITYYFRHREEVENYLERRRRHAEALRRENEARLRGGSAWDEPTPLRSAYRGSGVGDRSVPLVRGSRIGFRCARDPRPQP